jgi:hypothetical protein
MRVRAVAGLIVGMLVLAGCASGNSGSGGGWHDSNYDDTKRASFGFRWKCDPTTSPYETYSGQMDFIDRGAQIGGYVVAVHVWVKNATSPFVDCDLEVPYGEYLAPYRPQPKKIAGDGGTATFAFWDGGEPGPTNDDMICLELVGGAFGGYESCSTIDGGNIQVKTSS